MSAEMQLAHEARYKRLLAFTFIALLVLGAYVCAFVGCVAELATNGTCASSGPTLTIGLSLCGVFMLIICGACSLGDPTGPGAFVCEGLDVYFPQHAFVENGHAFPI